MDIVISNTSGDPIYQQIFDQISAQIIQGKLPGDFCLPPIRTVAKELRISVITVKRAWEELEHTGLIYTMAGKGCFVAPNCRMPWMPNAASLPAKNSPRIWRITRPSASRWKRSSP